MTLIKCKECKKKIAHDATTCPKCGTKSPFNLVNCLNKKCEHKIPEGINKCPYCNKDQVTKGQMVIVLVVLIGVIYATFNLFSDESNEKSSQNVNTFLQYKDSTLADIRKFSSSKRENIYKDYYSSNKEAFIAQGEDKATACLSDYVHTKSETLTLSQIGKWCLDNVKQGRDFNKFVNREKFEHYFSDWDGSFRPLVKMVKAAMNDPDSFEHDKTMYYITDGKARIRMNYRGKNAFGGVVPGSILVKVDPATGDILQILENQ